jgi:hypothetical protein
MEFERITGSLTMPSHLLRDLPNSVSKGSKSRRPAYQTECETTLPVAYQMTTEKHPDFLQKLPTKMATEKSTKNALTRSSEPGSPRSGPPRPYRIPHQDMAISSYTMYNISNNPGFRLKHPGVPDGSDGSDGTSYPLTENYTLPVAQATGRVAQDSTWERQRQTCERLGAPRITVEHSGKNNIWERCWCAWNS